MVGQAAGGTPDRSLVDRRSEKGADLLDDELTVGLHLPLGVEEQAVIDEITSGMPLGDEIPTDDDVAEAIGFFCSDRSRMVTGETLQVHAGENLR